MRASHKLISTGEEQELLSDSRDAVMGICIRKLALRLLLTAFAKFNIDCESQPDNNVIIIPIAAMTKAYCPYSPGLKMRVNTLTPTTLKTAGII